MGSGTRTADFPGLGFPHRIVMVVAAHEGMRDLVQQRFPDILFRSRYGQLEGQGDPFLSIAA